MNGPKVGSTAGDERRRPGRPRWTALLVGPADVAAETMDGVRPLLATMAATAGAMLTAILWA